jgi:hypothetical protein
MEASAGAPIVIVVTQAHDLAAELDQPILFRFNGIMVEVDRDSSVIDVVTKYNRDFAAQ